jgi:lipoprotein NlpD
VKHNDTYLSAYGHNDALLVAEGAQVKSGQVIARMGSTSADSVKLHFEIRRNGRPVNPTALMPAR